MTIATNLGYPRIGPRRELKYAMEAYWRGESGQDELRRVAAELRKAGWQRQTDAGIGQIPSNDFSFYDHVLDTACMVGAVPSRFGAPGDEVDLDTYFAMARGAQDGRRDVPAMEMTKWFDTNYHYIVPEFERDQIFQLASQKPVREFQEAKAAGIHTRPVLLGPVSFLRLGKPAEGADHDPLELLDRLLPVYAELLARLANAGADWVQMDEPVLAFDGDPKLHQALARAYTELGGNAKGAKLLLTTYFDRLDPSTMEQAAKLPVAGIHVDLCQRPWRLTDLLRQVGSDTVVSLGLVDGRNVWRTDLSTALDTAEAAVTEIGRDRLMIGPSCSLLHVPLDLESETKLDDELKRWLAFAKQKLDELTLLARGVDEGRDAIRDALKESDAVQEQRRTSTRINDRAVQNRLRDVTPDMMKRQHGFAERRAHQRTKLQLPKLPTTIIGSLPQTKEVRRTRAEYRRGDRDWTSYEKAMKDAIAGAVKLQDEIGLDVLAHGEFERNDMVEYFGEQLSGFAFTEHAWVQSFGSRCVKPPIIYGDVARPKPMTVDWTTHAAKQTDKPMKGMLTGPVTILKWSFVRDDLPWEDTCKQIALAIRDEVRDLEQAGLPVVQIDEPAFREALPLKRQDWDAYLKWAVESFRLASSGVRDETQIHTHMCYSEFNDIIGAIADMDADVISIETSRSQMELLEAFTDFKYPNEIGPGVYDIHSPRVPSVDEMAGLIEEALKRLSPDQVWVNPDCGLKTRDWPETKKALANMVSAAQTARSKHKL
jgi:5-methyltetrahydropteroyltriglutamate--homocysteine methyltransferase